MSECLHLHDAEDRHVGNVCIGGPYKYQPMVHHHGKHKWQMIGKPVERISDAFHMLGDALEENRRSSWRYNRAGILAIEQGESYYEPEMVYEVTVR